MSIQQNLNTLINDLPETVTLVAVSKTKPNSDIMEAYHVGQRDFGENKIQDMVEKADALPKDIRWHMIGHVQRNKVKYMAGFVHLIHGIDNLKLLKEVDKQAQKHNRIIDCLLQIKIAEEDSKFGMTAAHAKTMLQTDVAALKNIRIVGVMGMATFTDNHDQIKNEFQRLKTIFEDLKSIVSPNCEMKTISMGMSGDYPLAIACGSNMIRVGSSIFGARNY
ncbi:alanine racemase [Mangrovimonas yunxiaonensis]|uniref:Pyridoxal phosphate homeostasis protein n=1 Tax=Mangrovimonas yunxiaonensis TaxID=1197477 RepID=A0A084TN43_9FLAO|nr:YggS family pyridoxal phosphate-dependent enzyme [Mangrovimonas yunxiaonensis]KFB02129.1 alanine racemase [Mangrovimonas yunxiaonensis]GGH47748.1 YggS family pyridoxal phosphate enzyme [Mangrovimonas yunxiaonensis]